MGNPYVVYVTVLVYFRVDDTVDDPNGAAKSVLDEDKEGLGIDVA